MKVLITGAAGFIGYGLSRFLLERGDEVIGWDNLNHYYDVRIKEARLKQLQRYPNFKFEKLDISDKAVVQSGFEKYRPQRVVNLAAQAGVRYSIENPHAYVEANLVGFINILEGCRHTAVEHLVYASTSSVYGMNRKLPFSVEHSVDHPVSLYAATKKANELMAHSYSHLYQLPVTGLRFFTVYGPWGRPDMALFRFTKNILEDQPIDVYNFGDHRRDFTYVDDIVAGVAKVLDKPAVANPKWDPLSPESASSSAPYRLYNIGNNNPVQLVDFISALEKALGKKAIRNLLPMQPGDVLETYADVASLEKDFDFRPATSIEQGVAKFVEWYKEFYKVGASAPSPRTTSSEPLSSPA